MPPVKQTNGSRRVGVRSAWPVARPPQPLGPARKRLVDAIEQANVALREKGYAERDLAVHPGPFGKALLKGNKILSPLSDEADVVLTIVQERVPPGSELGSRVLRAADLRAAL